MGNDLNPRLLLNQYHALSAFTQPPDKHKSKLGVSDKTLSKISPSSKIADTLKSKKHSFH